MFKNIKDFFEKHWYLSVIFMISGIILIVAGYYYKDKESKNSDSQQSSNKSSAKISCVETDCFPYKCQNDKCLDKCTSNSDCIYGYNCLDTKCIRADNNNQPDNNQPDNNQPDNNTRIPGDELWQI